LFFWVIFQHQVISTTNETMTSGWKNRALVGLDWLRGEIFGRDTSRIA